MSLHCVDVEEQFEATNMTIEGSCISVEGGFTVGEPFIAPYQFSASELVVAGVRFCGSDDTFTPRPDNVQCHDHAVVPSVREERVDGFGRVERFVVGGAIRRRGSGMRVFEVLGRFAISSWRPRRSSPAT